ncbi:MAG: antibiotic biosynthesis monooxygenase [Candidatus Bathyarchaeota archaeon]|nr:antibiotic biosynthesis monooxygenase [Candidatus Bathyarchaeota archaeon]
MQQKYVVVSSLVFARMSVWTFKPGKREEGFLELDNILNISTRHAQGFRGYMSLLSHEDVNSAVILTLWQDEDSLRATEKGIFAKAIKKVKYSLTKPPEVKNFRVFSTELFQRLEKSTL